MPPTVSAQNNFTLTLKPNPQKGDQWISCGFNLTEINPCTTLFKIEIVVLEIRHQFELVTSAQWFKVFYPLVFWISSSSNSYYPPCYTVVMFFIPQFKQPNQVMQVWAGKLMVDLLTYINHIHVHICASF